MVLFFTHIPFVVNRAFNATPTETLQQHPLLFTTNRTDRTFFLWRLHPARPSHPGHSTILLRSESPSGKCAKLHTVVASNNRDYMPWSLYCCLFVLHIYGVVLRAHSVRGEPCIQRNANREVATQSMAKVLLRLFCNSNCIHLCPHITLSSSSNVNTVEWLVSIPVVRVFIGSALTISYGLAWRDYTFDGNAFYIGCFFKKFKV